MHKNAKPNPHDHFIRPFVFMLQEGNHIQKDFLDYSLLMLQTIQSEVIKSPPSNSSKATSNRFVDLLKK